MGRIAKFLRAISSRIRQRLGLKRKLRLADRVVVIDKPYPANAGEYKLQQVEFPGDDPLPAIDLGVPISLLHLAAKTGDTELMQDMIATNADVNELDEHGMTALHYAAALGARGCVRALVYSGKCIYSIRDKAGRTAAELADEWSKDRAVAELLAKKQAREINNTEARNPG